LISYSLSPAQSYDEHKKGPVIESDHWLLGKDLYEKLNYDSLWNNATDIKNSSEGQKLIDKCIESYGGYKNLENINTLKLDYNSNLALVDGVQQITKYYQVGIKYKTVINENDSIFILERGLNGRKVWHKTVEFLKENVRRHHYKKELFEYLQQSMPLGIKTENFSSIKYGKRDNDILEYIYLKNNDSLITILGINPEDFLIYKIEGVIIEEDKRYVHMYILSDFKKYEGYLFPYKRKYISMGLEVSNSDLKSIEINPAFKDNEFRVQY
jgi:hypothetical protein